MFYVKKAIDDLDNLINKTHEYLKNFDTHTSDDYDIWELLHHDFNKICWFKDVFMKGDIKQSLEYVYSFETSVRDMIPSSTYELIGGRLIHDEDKSFDNVISHSPKYQELVSVIFSLYKNDKDATKHEEELYSIIKPYAFNKEETLLDLNNERNVLLDCLKHLETFPDEQSEKLVKRIKRTI